jgi:hypothetical protein
MDGDAILDIIRKPSLESQGQNTMDGGAHD